MSQKLPVNSLKWKTDMFIFDEEFIKNYDENSNKGYINGADVEYPKDLHALHSYLSFLPGRMKINKCNKLACNLYNKKIFCPHKSLKTGIGSWTSFKKSVQSDYI